MQFIMLLLIILFFNIGILAQPTTHKTTNKTEIKESIQKFNTADEQEEYDVKQMFKNEYKKQHYKRYSGTVKTPDNINFQFGTLVMVVDYTSPELKPIFEQGILYPSLFTSEDSLRITDLHILKYVDNGPTYKRFSLWIFRKWLANPQVYYLELNNEKSNGMTDLKEFIKGSHLTYFKAGSIII